MQKKPRLRNDGITVQLESQVKSVTVLFSVARAHLGLLLLELGAS